MRLLKEQVKVKQLKGVKRGLKFNQYTPAKGKRLNYQRYDNRKLGVKLSLKSRV
jgi:hypothetical protein